MLYAIIAALERGDAWSARQLMVPLMLAFSLALSYCRGCSSTGFSGAVGIWPAFYPVGCTRYARAGVKAWRDSSGTGESCYADPAPRAATFRHRPLSPRQGRLSAQGASFRNGRKLGEAKATLNLVAPFGKA